MTQARIQPFCMKHNIIIGCYDGSRINRRNTTERNIALHAHKNHFCLTSKSQNVKFQRATDEVKPNFNIFDDYISDEHVKTFIKNEHLPKKIQPQITSTIVFDFETYNTGGAVAYSVCKYKLR